MITKPVIIVGAPRSGTSMLFHILRTTQSFWSLPSEGFHIWNILCHPSLNNWESEEFGKSVVSEADKEMIIRLYEEQIMPAWFWKRVNHGLIWKFSNTRTQKIGRKLQGELFIKTTKMLYYMNPVRKIMNRRLLDKSLNNCLRLDLVKQIFPEARFIYMKRKGADSIKSLINGWLNPDRFVTFSPDRPIRLKGYAGREWKFVMPVGWRAFDERHIVDLCIWQWKMCHEKILEFRDRNCAKFLEIKLEDLPADPVRILASVASFTEIPFGNFSDYIRHGLPRVNQTPNASDDNFRFPDLIPHINSEITPLMRRLGYD